jgi:putative Mn2+ efflux pump MntP
MERVVLLGSGVSFGAIVLLAFGLAMDATAVSAARGAAVDELRGRDVALVAGLFGGFHALMPTVGWLAGSQLGAFLENWDHWFAFAILGGIGVRMVVQAFQAPAEIVANPLAPGVLLGLAVATSLDALAVGVTLPLVGAPPVLAIAIIAIVTGVASGVALLVGQRLRKSLGRVAAATGGLVLVAIGTKVLVEHLSS